MIACPQCGAELQPGASTCPKCGAPFPPRGTRPVEGAVGLPQPAADDPVLAQLQRFVASFYKVERVLGRGRATVVYKAAEINPPRAVTLKVLPPGLGAGPAATHFKDEARKAMALNHPNIVPIYRVGLRAGAPYFVATKLVDGRDLGAVIAAQGALAVPATVVVLRAVAEALDYSHARGTVHGHLQATDVLLDRNGQVAVSDFGIARIVEEAAPAPEGRLPFHSPEQAAAGPVGPASDQYALGIVALQMLTGTLPTDADALSALRHARATREGLPEGLVNVIQIVLAQDPVRRYASTADLLAALTAIPLGDADRQAAIATLGQLARGERVPKVVPAARAPHVETKTVARSAIPKPGAAAAPAPPHPRAATPAPSTRAADTPAPAAKPSPASAPTEVRPAVRVPAPPPPPPAPPAPPPPAVEPPQPAPAPEPTPEIAPEHTTPPTRRVWAARPPAPPPPPAEEALSAESAAALPEMEPEVEAPPPASPRSSAPIEPAAPIEPVAPVEQVESAGPAEEAPAARPVLRPAPFRRTTQHTPSPFAALTAAGDEAPPRRSRTVWIVAAVVVVAVAAAAAYFLIGRGTAAKPMAQAPAPTQAPPAAAPAAPVVPESAKADTSHPAPAAATAAKADTTAPVENSGLLLLSTVPTTAQVLVDGTPSGSDGFVDTEVTAGRRHLVISDSGYVTLDTLILVRVGGSTELGRVALKAEAPPPPVKGRLLLHTTPPTAQIFVDGQAVGVGQFGDFELLPGQRQLRITARGYVTVDTVVTMNAGATVQLGTITLTKVPGGP